MTPAVQAALDPLASDRGDTPAAERVSIRRRIVQAPSVTGINGAQAVTELRARGLIAAIESVQQEQGDLPIGWVITQDPAPGTPLDREAVVALQLVAPHVDDDESDAPITPAEEPRPGDEDDTEQWFLALADVGPEQAAVSPTTRHKRKPGHLGGAVLDTSPAPRRPGVVSPSPTARRGVKVRRWSLLLALVVGVLLVAVVVAATQGGRARSSSASARTIVPASPPRLITPAREVPRAHSPRRRRLPRHPARRSRRRRVAARISRTRIRPRAQQHTAPVVGRAADTTRSEPTPDERTTSTQFAYLGQ